MVRKGSLTGSGSIMSAISYLIDPLLNNIGVFCGKLGASDAVFGGRAQWGCKTESEVNVRKYVSE